MSDMKINLFTNTDESLLSLHISCFFVRLCVFAIMLNHLIYFKMCATDENKATLTILDLWWE